MPNVRILIIEDDVCILENMAELLELEGYRVITASNGRDGLKKIKDHIPDLIICDLLMPKMDGLTLLQILGNHAELKKIPFIFSSAKSEKKDIKKGLDSGADDFLVKPFELEDLLASIKKCLTERQIP